MEKDQPDSLATVAVGSEKIPQPHSHYAPSEVYSSTEPPPAYMRPPMKSTAIQIARIAAMTMITMSVILGSFILAASWVQARASCTPESIAAMQAELKFQQQQREARFYQQQGEFLKHLQPEPLIGDPIESKDSLQRLAESSVVKKEVEAETKDMKMQKEEEDSKVDSESGDHDEDEDDYDDDGFPPVHIKLPLQLDLDDSIGTLMQQARNRISCVVERRRADEVTDGINDNTLDSNNTDAGRFQRLSGERVAILCESGNPNQQETQEQEMLTLVPLGTVQIPLQPQEPSAGYHQYQINTQYQVPDMQQLPLSNPRGLNHIPQDVLSAEFRNAPRLNMEMRPPRMGPQIPSMGPQVEMRHVEVHHLPIDILRGMRPPMVQEQQHQPQPRQEPQHAIPVIYQHNEQNPGMYGQEQGAAMMPPPPPQSASTILEQRMIPQMMIATEQKPPAPPQPSAERQRALFQDPQSEIEKIIQEIPSEIKNFIQHLTGSEVRFPVPEGARREMVEGLVFPVPRFPLPLRSVDSLEVPVEARAEVTAEHSSEPQQQHQQQQQQQLPEERQKEQPLTHLIIQQEQEQQEQQNPQELENRPHYVQPRSVRSVPDAFNPAAHRREKRMRRCACDCAC